MMMMMMTMMCFGTVGRVAVVEVVGCGGGSEGGAGGDEYVDVGNGVSIVVVGVGDRCVDRAVATT